MRRLKRCAEPLGLGRRGDGSVDVDGNSTRFGCRLSSTEFLLKSLALLFIAWAFSPGQGHISNSFEVATVPQLQQAGRWPLPPSNWWGSLFFFRPSAGHPPSYPWFGIHVPLPPWDKRDKLEFQERKQPWIIRYLKSDSERPLGF